MTDKDVKQAQIDSFNADIEGLEQERDKLLQYVNATEGAIMYAKGKRDKLQAELDGEPGEPMPHPADVMANLPESFQPAQNGADGAKMKKR